MPLTDIYRGQEDNTVFSIRSSESGGGRVILTSNFEDIRAGWFEGDVALTIPGFSALFSSEFQAEGLQSFLASLIKMLMSGKFCQAATPNISMVSRF